MKKILLASLLAIIMVMTSPFLVALAIGNPDSITIHSSRFFQNIFEDGDQLLVFRYDVAFSTAPDELPQETWMSAIFDVPGTTSLSQRPLQAYYHNVISIYLEPSRALPWGQAYKSRIMGYPSIYGAFNEGVNGRTRTLSFPLDYITANMTESRAILGGYCIAIAKALEPDLGYDLLNASDLLNEQGAALFETAIPGLGGVVPEIFELASTTPGITIPTRTVQLVGTIVGVYSANETVRGLVSGANMTFIEGSQTVTTIQGVHSGNTMFTDGENATGLDSTANITITGKQIGQLEINQWGVAGTFLRNTLQGLGTWLGFSSNTAGGAGIVLLYFLTAGAIFAISGNITGGLILAVPIILLGNFLGLIAFVITWAICIVAVMVFAIFFFMGRMA